MSTNDLIKLNENSLLFIIIILISFFANSVAGEHNTERQVQKYEEILNLLKDIESEVTETWLDKIPSKIERNLNKSLLIIHPNHFLELNFTDEVLHFNKLIV